MRHVEADIWQHLTRLCVEIGPRPIGSPGNLAAADYIQGVFEDCRLRVDAQPYPCPSWACLATRLELDGQPLEATANAFSPACDVIAPVTAVGTEAELAATKLAGRIGLLYGDLAAAPLAPKSWFLKTERDARIYQLLEASGVAALLTAQAATAELTQVIEDAEFNIPSATVPPAVALALLKHARPTAALRIDSRRTGGMTSNMIARLAGARPERIVICAHYDTKFSTPGASDNGAGVAALLALAQHLSRRSWQYALEFVAFTGEEYLPMGDDEYVSQAANDFGQIVAAINIDGAGLYLGANSITALACSQAFQDDMAQLTKPYPGVVWVDPWPESNHSTFAFRGVPSLALSSVGIRNIAHHPADTIEQVSPAKLGEVVMLVADIVERLQDKPLAWCRSADFG